MRDQDYLDFLSVWGDQFCEALREQAGEVVASHQDAYEAFVQAFGKDPTPAVLASLSAQDMERLREACEKVLDRSPVPVAILRGAIARISVAWGHGTDGDA